MTAQTTARPQPRGALRLIFDPVFGALFWGKMFSVVAVWTHGIVAAIVIFDATGSAVMVGMVGVAQFLPQLILSPTSGKWADIGDPARQILWGRGSTPICRAPPRPYRCSSAPPWWASGS